VQERREKKRVSIRNNVRYGTSDPPQHISFITNLSPSGLCIRTNKIFPPGTNLFLVLEGDEGPLNAEGVVVWSRKAPPHLVRYVQSGMGIRFTRLDQGLLNLIEKRALIISGR